MPYLELTNGEKAEPVVVEMEICFADFIERFKHRVFMHYDDEFAEFVFMNRIHLHKQMHDYDFILGVMSDMNPDGLLSEYYKGNLSKNEVLDGLLLFTAEKKK